MDLYYGIALSLHLSLPGEYNYIHPYVGVNYNNFIVGTYYNSEYNMSTYAGYNFVIDEDTNLELGAVTGYSGADVVPMAKLNHKNIFISPGIDNGDVGVVVGLDWRF